ncbi:MAG: riboflavin synthase [Actinobacteria bacterium]|nr:riboflavin synthase [Actinomycetota bacterium]
MFAGIIEELGEVKSFKKGSSKCVIEIEGKKIFDGLKIGDSVSVNGTCLTVSSLKEKRFFSDIMTETLKKTALGDISISEKVNLERALVFNSRLGGHFVSGHIDGAGIIVNKKKDKNSYLFQIKTSSDILKYLIKNGSIAVDGISLTVMDILKDSFMISIIPHTFKNTTLGFKNINSKVNLETDMIAKYVENFLNQKKRTKNSRLISLL